MFFKKPKADNMRVDEPEKTEEKIYSFQKIFARQNPGILKTSEVEPLSNLDYKKELNLKNEAFREFLNANKIHAEKIDDILPSPKPRQYRTTTKRKVILQKGKFVLNFNESAKYISNDGVAFSNLEPEEHLNIYKFIIKQINETNLKITARHLNYIIIRGNYREFSVIFNVDKLHAKIIKSLKDFSGRIKDANLKVMSSFIFVDPLKSDYYFESSTPDIPLRFKKLFGPDKLFKEFRGKKISLHPTSFSQVNESVVPLMIEKIRKMLSNCHFERLVDLYCGYGLFSVFLNDSFDEVIGIDSAKLSIESAIDNQKYNKGKSKIRFICGKISNILLEKVLPASNDRITETIILDPPKNGCNKAVIKYIASRKPKEIIHIFCGTDEIPDSLKEWKQAGYQAAKIIPLDMFAGTLNLETMVLLVKK